MNKLETYTHIFDILWKDADIKKEKIVFTQL